jgi:hypothetical protein
MQVLTDAQWAKFEAAIAAVKLRRARQTQTLGEVSAKLAAPVPDALMSDHHAAFRENEFDVAQAEAEEMIEPRRVCRRLFGLSHAAMACSSAWA